jgi:hypothetical protein
MEDPFGAKGANLGLAVGPGLLIYRAPAIKAITPMTATIPFILLIAILL